MRTLKLFLGSRCLNMNKIVYIGILYVSILAVLVEPAKILSIFNIPSKSHYLYGVALLKELASRGHEITSVTLYPQKTPVKNFRDVFIEDNLNIIENLVSDGYSGEYEDPAQMVTKIQDMAVDQVKNIIENEKFKELMKEKFDLIILEVLWNEALFGLGEYFNAPIIGMSTFGEDVGIDDLVGNTSPNSVVPNLHYGYTPDMTFFQRLHNLIGNARTYLAIYWKGLPEQKELYERYFPNAKLKFEEALKKLSLLILNQHPSVLYPRSNVPNVIEAIGLHIPKTIDPLPKDLQNFLDNSPEGVVYMSFGTNIQSQNLPVEKRDMFFNVFRKLKHKVLWKFEDTNVPNKPDNVHIITWAPQQAILNHTNVKVFITHGGLLGTTEAVHFGKPMLGIPFLWDQHRNLAMIQKKGVGITLYYPTLSEKQLEDGLNELLYNSTYTEKAKEVSKQYHDQPLSPLDNAVYWVEYVLRHKGAYHLRNAAIDLNIFQYYSLDLIAFLLLILFVVIYIVIRVVKILFIRSFVLQVKQRRDKPKRA